MQSVGKSGGNVTSSRSSTQPSAIQAGPDDFAIAYAEHGAIGMSVDGGRATIHYLQFCRESDNHFDNPTPSTYPIRARHARHDHTLIDRPRNFCTCLSPDCANVSGTTDKGRGGHRHKNLSTPKFPPPRRRPQPPAGTNRRSH